MANRNIFSRSYTGFNSGGTEVFVIDGAGVSTTLPTTRTFTAGETLIQGDFVYVSGTQVLKASALSGVASARYGVIGAATANAPSGSGVAISTDGIVTVSSANITADVSLVPGQYYYLSKYSGQITRYSTASGTISLSGTDQYQAAVNVGVAVSNTELELEIQPPIVLYY